MSANPRRRDEIRVESRRTKVLKLYLEHHTQAEIAAMLDTNQSTISRDIAAIEQEWRANSQRILDDHKARMLADKAHHSDKKAARRAFPME